ncbi:MAG: prolyl oligopeptidase family serine peptidase [Bacteroidales bacterium]|jgi:dipeptidyl aminopeptidase/acylaminoacyl peptidase|nr:prolyl oligopeptidase family serine peptidase [Bacteroidales bacterium]
MRKLLLFAFISIHFYASGQKQPLDHSVYDSWKSITQSVISPNGSWVAFTINPQEGDGWLYIADIRNGLKDSVARGGSPRFSPASDYVAYTIVPAATETRQAKRKKLKEDMMPKQNLEIRKLPGNETFNATRIKSFSVAEEKSPWMAYHLEKPVPVKENADSSKAANSDADVKNRKKDLKGSELVVFNPLSNSSFNFPDVTEYVVAKGGNSISFIQELPDTSLTTGYRVSLFDCSKGNTVTLFEGRGSVIKLTTDKSGLQTSFLYSADTSKAKVYTLFLSRSFTASISIVDTINRAMPQGWSVSENSNMEFSENGKRLFFGTSPKPVREPEDTLLAEEKYKLDVWSWTDGQIQPQQKKQLDRELKRVYQAVYHTDKNAMYQLTDKTMPELRLNTRSDCDFTLGMSGLEYEKSSSWDARNYADYFIVNVETGEKRLILKKYPSHVQLSQDGNFLAAWSPGEKSWNLMSREGVLLRKVTLPENFPQYNELHDSPSDPSPYGIAGWTEKDRHLLIYDGFDIWSVNTGKSEEPVNITNGSGRLRNIRFRYVKTDPDEEFIPSGERILLSAFDNISKEAGFFSVRPYSKDIPAELILEKAVFTGGVSKAKNSDMLIWRKESVDVSPELFISDMKFTLPVKLSVTNPQQKNFNWMTAELVEWTSFDNQTLSGVLYKPENFDPSGKYPMIVYFYERSSDGLNSYFPPAPSASVINRSYAVSNGYLLFVPDIVYTTGYPGESCYNAVVSGTQALLDRYDFIDRNRLGLDGQSWGGYQIAWLVTRTDMFRCAFAGAPVSNMTSAYGGIRWESGMSRMFQYEMTQSRIGGTLWEKPMHYIENSALFYVPKINTPLLLMHNDADGAVPWYQGIELFMALRRLEKPAWMLSYNDEAHNLVKRPNRKDLSIRKMQFFDHYLKDVDMPYWMKNGLSQTEKGKIDGYELIENK